MLKPLRRRGTIEARVRRLRKWARRGRYNMIENTYPNLWIWYVRKHTSHSFALAR